MQAFRLNAAPELTVNVKRSRRARRLSLRVSSLDGTVTLTMPPGTPERVGRAFAEEKARWLSNAVGKIAVPVPVVMGAEVPVLGQLLRVTAGKGRGARILPDRIEAPLGREGIAVEAALKHLARAKLAAASDRFSALLGKSYGRITLRDTRSRWGSCSHEGNLMYSWRLVMAPEPVLNYVAAHEVAHLKHMDHSPTFWATVEDLFPDHKAQRDWLRQDGSALHKFRFRQTD